MLVEEGRWISISGSKATGRKATMTEFQRSSSAGEDSHNVGVDPRLQAKETPFSASAPSAPELLRSPSTSPIIMMSTDLAVPRESKEYTEPAEQAEQAEPSASPLLPRKPVIPPRSSRASLDKRSYSPIPLSDLSIGSRYEGPSKHQLYKERSALLTSKEHLESGHLPPKSFYKTHYFFRWDLGYWRMPARHVSVFAILFICTFIPGWYSQEGFAVIITDSGISPFGFDCTVTPGWSFVGNDLLLFENISFGVAKAIDLAWNWVVGRGLQGILTLLAYRVFNDALLRVVEMTPIPFGLFATLALPSSKIELLWQLCKNLFRHGNWRAKMIFFWLIFSTVYLIAVPGLMDAATAYEASIETTFLWPSSNESVKAYSLSDWRTNSSIVEISNHICIRFYSSYDCGWDPSISCYNTPGKDIVITNFTYITGSSEICKNNTKQDENKFLVYLPDAGLYNWKDETINNTWWTKFRDSPLQALDESTWADWKFEPAARSSFQCVVEPDSYQWGFSFEWLFLITTINGVWLWGLWILWLDCDTNSEFCRKRRHLGLWRAIADLSEAMREELGPNICAYSDDDLHQALKRRPPVKYYASGGGEDEPAHLGLSKRKSGRFIIRWGVDYGKEKGL